MAASQLMQLRTVSKLFTYQQHLRSIYISTLVAKHAAVSISEVSRATPSFVPRHRDTSEAELAAFEHALCSFPRLVVITGAGISTESGVPDYRSAEVGLYARSNHRPIKYQEFTSSEAARRRYWARNFAGWSRFSSVSPNAAHRALVEWQRRGRCATLVTQNVDGLHSAAARDDGGGGEVLELHGSAHRVRCLSCDFTQPRQELQSVMTRANPEFADQAPTALRPDGDVELDQVRRTMFVLIF